MTLKNLHFQAVFNGFCTDTPRDCSEKQQKQNNGMRNPRVFFFLEHNAYPVCPEHKIISKESLSDYQKKQAEKLNIPLEVSEKLIADLTNKEKYVIHYRGLKQVLQFGLKLKSISRILSFKQSRWLEKFIAFNTDMRQNAKNVFEKNFWKLMNNAFYGYVRNLN